MTDDRRARRRQQIVAAAAECFAQHTYADVHLDDLAHRAGITKMMLYRYFEGKEDIYRAVLDQMVDAITRELAGLESPVTSDAVTRAHFAVATEHPFGYRLFWSRARAEATFARHIAELERRVNDLATELLAEWVDLGPLRSWAGEVATRLSVAATLAYLSRADELDPTLVESYASEGLSGLVTAWVQMAGPARPAPGGERST